MSNRITEKMLHGSLQFFCKLSGIPYGHYRKTPDGSGRLGNGAFDTIPNGLDISGAYGGWRVEQIDSKGGTGVSDVFCSGYRSKRELYDIIHAAINTLRLTNHEVTK